jgi:hypothetical protein
VAVELAVLFLEGIELLFLGGVEGGTLIAGFRHDRSHGSDVGGATRLECRHLLRNRNGHCRTSF